MRVAPFVLILITTTACGGGKSETAGVRGGGPVPVMTVPAEKRTVPVRLLAVGTVEPMSTVDIRPQVGGVLASAAFTDGQEVRKGDLLFKIDDRPYVATRDQVQGALARDRAQAVAAEHDAARARDLAKQRFISQSDLDKAIAAADAVKATIQADEAAVRSAELAVQWCTIHSPIDGRTGAIQVKPGNVVVANTTTLSATPLVTIHRMRPIWVSFPIPEARLPEVRDRIKNSKIEIEAWPQGDPGPALIGLVTFLSNQVDRVTGTVLVKATFPNGDGRLWPGQFVRISAIVGRVDGAVVVPTQAIQEGQQGSYLFVVRADGTAELRKVRTGVSDDGWTVVDGAAMAPGDKVVVDGQSRLIQGAATQERGKAEGKPAGKPAETANP